MRFATLLIFLVVLAITLVLPARTTMASSGACLYAPRPDPWDRLALVAPDAQLILVGYVTDEYPVVKTRGPGGEFRPLSDPGPSDRPGIYQSKVRVEAVLKGDDPGPELTLNFLSDEWQCVGGPRLFEGTRVLLMLNFGAFETWPGGASLHWQTGPTGSPMIFKDGGALLLDYDAFEYKTGRRSQFVGPSDHVLKRVAREAGASEEATKQALAAIGASTNRSPMRFVFTTVVLVGLSGLLVAMRVRGAR